MKKYFASLVLAVCIVAAGHSQTTAKEWYENGLSLKTSEKYTEAIDAFKKAVALKTDYALAWHQLGWCYNEAARYTEAVEALKNEEKAGSPDKQTYFFELGYAYKGLKQYDDALTAFNSALDLNGNYVLAYKERGNTYMKLKEYEKSLSDYNKYASLATEIKDALFYYNKGWVENDLAKYEEAVKSLKECVALDNTYQDGFSELAYSYYELNRNEDAILNYRIAMEQDDKDYHPVIGIADVYFDNLKNYDSAIIYFEKGVKLEQVNKRAFFRLGWCYNDKDRFADAIEPLKQAVLMDGDYDVARIELGYAYYKLDKYDDALVQFRSIMSKNAKDELSRYYAGFCFYLKADQDNLKKMIRELTALNATKYVETLTKYIK